MRLRDKVAIVTGAASGFGEGIARRFVAEGAKVVVADIAIDAAERVAADRRRRRGRVSRPTSRSDGDVGAMLAATLAAFGGVDIVVNNAGTTHRNRPMLEVTEAEFDRVYAVNVKSIFLTAKHFVPHFRAQGGGAFVNIASTAGVRPRPGLTWYNGSKGAVITTSRSMAAELGPDNIRVNCVNPVMAATGLLTEFMGDGRHAGEPQALRRDDPDGSLLDAGGRRDRVPVSRVRRCEVHHRRLSRGRRRPMRLTRLAGTSTSTLLR